MLTGPSLSDKKITVHILDAIDVSIQRYMFTLLVANVLLALLTWTAFSWIGLDNAGGWAIAAGVLHVIPYLGPTLIAVATGMAGFMQFDSFWMALMVSGSSLAIAIFVGIFVVTWMTGKISKMNPVAVFISLLFWGWLWGVWGLLLAIPIIGIVKVVSQHIKELHPVAELLRELKVSLHTMSCRLRTCGSPRGSHRPHGTSWRSPHLCTHLQMPLRSRCSFQRV